MGATEAVESGLALLLTKRFEKPVALFSIYAINGFSQFSIAGVFGKRLFEVNEIAIEVDTRFIASTAVRETVGIECKHHENCRVLRQLAEVAIEQFDIANQDSGYFPAISENGGTFYLGAKTSSIKGAALLCA